MNDRAPPCSSREAPTRLSRVADGCALLTAAVGLLAVAGWLLGIDPLKRVLPGLAAMKFNTALGFILAGSGLWWRKRVPVRLALGALVALMGALSLAEHLAGLDLRIDQIFVRDILAPQEAAFPPGRMALSTALCFLLLGVGLLGSGGARRLDSTQSIGVSNTSATPPNCSRSPPLLSVACRWLLFPQGPSTSGSCPAS